MNFIFKTANEIKFGTGIAAELPHLAPKLGKRIMLISGSHPERYLAHLKLNFIAQFKISNEPTIEDVETCVQIARTEKIDAFIALGGGSVIDLAKASAILTLQKGTTIDYVEVIGEGLPLLPISLPVIAVPTTAGTGSEVTKNSVLFSTRHQVKVSLRAEVMLPKIALIDPNLTLTCPQNISAQSGMDALTHCIESYTTWASNPLVDEFCLSGFKYGAVNLPKVYHDGSCQKARELMSLCSLFGGLSLANAKLGAVHGFAGILGGLTGLPHGAICAALLPKVTQVNINAMLTRQPDNPALSRYRDLARVATGQENLNNFINWLFNLTKTLQLSNFTGLNLTASQCHKAILGANAASSMKGNPIELTDSELHEILMSIN